MKMPSTNDINDRASALSREFYAFCEEAASVHPEMTDRRVIFEGWALQKLASLQLLVEQLCGDANVESGPRS